MGVSRLLGAAVGVGMAIVIGAAAPAGAQGDPPNATVYELTESQRIRGHRVVKRSAASALAGWVQPGSAICTAAIVARYGLETTGCYVNIHATNRIDLATGLGPVRGTFDVLVQDRNVVDAPESIVMSGTLEGDMDLSAAVLGDPPVPLGTIVGTWRATGNTGTPVEGATLGGPFTGIFRLPFVLCLDGSSPTAESTCALTPPLYLIDPETSDVVPLAPTEFAIGIPAVRLELNLR